jgi:hypothetical protein
MVHEPQNLIFIVTCLGELRRQGGVRICPRHPVRGWDMVRDRDRDRDMYMDRDRDRDRDMDMDMDRDRDKDMNMDMDMEGKVRISNKPGLPAYGSWLRDVDDHGIQNDLGIADLGIREEEMPVVSPGGSPGVPHDEDAASELVVVSDKQDAVEAACFHLPGGRQHVLRCSDKRLVILPFFGMLADGEADDDGISDRHAPLEVGDVAPDSKPDCVIAQGLHGLREGNAFRNGSLYIGLVPSIVE